MSEICECGRGKHHDVHIYSGPGYHPFRPAEREDVKRVMMGQGFVDVAIAPDLGATVSHHPAIHGQQASEGARCTVCGHPKTAPSHQIPPTQKGPPWYPAWDHPFQAPAPEAKVCILCRDGYKASYRQSDGASHTCSGSGKGGRVDANAGLHPLGTERYPGVGALHEIRQEHEAPQVRQAQGRPSGR